MVNKSPKNQDFVASMHRPMIHHSKEADVFLSTTQMVRHLPFSPCKDSSSAATRRCFPLPKQVLEGSSAVRFKQKIRPDSCFSFFVLVTPFVQRQRQTKAFVTLQRCSRLSFVPLSYSGIGTTAARIYIAVSVLVPSLLVLHSKSTAAVNRQNHHTITLFTKTKTL